MKKLRFSRYVGCLVMAIVASVSMVGVESVAATKKTKAKTTQTARKKTSSSSKKRTTAKKTSSKKSSNRVRKAASTKPKTTQAAVEKPSDDPLTLKVNSAILDWMPKEQNPGGLRVNRVTPNKSQGTVGVSLNENFTYMPVSKDLINELTKVIRRNLPDSIADYNITLNVGSRNLAYYINKIDKLPAQYRANVPFVTALNPYVHPKKGMEGDIIALWHSHGRYFKGGGWQW
ncbi:MAG: hypothetical protein K2H21_01155, partial [Muribaculaceae bacterium]|nr:hypothetical protein [Muribaculaceae bacterium]